MLSLLKRFDKTITLVFLFSPLLFDVVCSTDVNMNTMNGGTGWSQGFLVPFQNHAWRDHEGTAFKAERPVMYRTWRCTERVQYSLTV